MSSTIIRNLLLLSILCFTLACSSQIDEEIELPEMEEEEEVDNQINYLALGDSYTIGQGVEESLRWPNQLADSLSDDGYPINAPKIIATTGWTTKQLIDAIEAEDVSNFNLVSLLIGVNNQYQNQPFEIFQTEFDFLLNKSIEIAGSKDQVFVVSIPDYGVTPFGSANSMEIALEIDMYNAYIEAQCLDNQISFIDITQISRDLGDSDGALASDKLHPSGSQYTAWVDKIFPVVKILLME